MSWAIILVSLRLKIVCLKSSGFISAALLSQAFKGVHLTHHTLLRRLYGCPSHLVPLSTEMNFCHFFLMYINRNFQSLLWCFSAKIFTKYYVKYWYCNQTRYFIRVNMHFIAIKVVKFKNWRYEFKLWNKSWIAISTICKVICHSYWQHSPKSNNIFLN